MSAIKASRNKALEFNQTLARAITIEHIDKRLP